MKIENIGWIYYFDNCIIFNSGLRKIVKIDLSSDINTEISLNSEILSLRTFNANSILINSNSASLIYNFELYRIGGFNFGNSNYNRIFKNLIFSESFLIQEQKNYTYNWIINQENGEISQLKINNSILDYIFHDQYFIPITYPYASSMSFGSDFTVYNYNGEAVWSKSFKDKSIYDPAAGLTDAEVANVNISSIKIVADTVIVTGSNKHAFCFNIHTGEQIWRQAGFTNLLVGIAVVDEAKGYFYTYDQEHFSKIDIKTGRIIHRVKIEEWLSARLAVNKTAYSLAADGIWVAGQTNGVVGRINKETLLVDLTYNLESHGTIPGSYAPHVTKEFVMMPDGLGNLEVIKRE